MEVFSSSVEDQLVDSLSYKLSPGSSYITDRKSVSYFQLGSNIYSTTTGTKLIRFVINGDDWLDATNTLRIFFDIRNTNANANTPLRVIGGPYSFFRRMRVLCGNTLVEDIDYYNRVHYMFDVMRARHVRDNEDAEAFDTRFDSPKYQPCFQNNSTNPAYVQYPFGTLSNFADSYISVNAGQSKTVSFKPLSGLLSCGKLLPIRWAPITVELELVQNAYDPIISVEDAALGIEIDGANGATSNTSVTWQIENPVIKVDICTLDNALNNEYASLLLSGKALPINYSSFVTQLQSIAGQTPSVNITRALSRLKSVFVTFDQAFAAAKAANQDVHIQVWKKPWNDFFHPMSYKGFVYDHNYELEYQLQIGSKLFPEYPMRNLQECFYQLRKCMGTETSNFHSLDITPFDYRNHKHIVAFDTEKMLGSAFTGLNMKTGSLMTLKVKAANIATLTSAMMPDTVYLVLHFDSILNIRDTSVEVFE